MILMYHNLDDTAGFNTVSAANFMRQLSWLSQQGYTVVKMDDYVAHIAAGKALKKLVAITFDDAYESFKDIALPLLRTHEFPAMVYVPTNFVGKTNQWDDGNIRIMNWWMLRDLLRFKEVSLGSHGQSHRRLRTLSEMEVMNEVSNSKSWLEAETGVRVRHFSYPYGQLRDFDSRCQREARVAGYRSACSTLWGRSNGPGDLFALRRIEIEPEDSIEEFAAKISRPFPAKFWRQQAKNLLFRLHLRR